MRPARTAALLDDGGDTADLEGGSPLSLDGCRQRRPVG
jgi:hypothetical protein